MFYTVHPHYFALTSNPLLQFYCT